MFIYSVEVDDSFAQPLLPDCAERLLDSHVGLQQRLIDTAMLRDGVIEIGKPGDIGHAVGLHRQAGNATWEQGARRSGKDLATLPAQREIRDGEEKAAVTDTKERPGFLFAKVPQNRIDESEPGNGDRLVQLLLFLDLNLPKNRAVFCDVFAEVCFPSINDFFHFCQLLFVGPDAAAFRTFV